MRRIRLLLEYDGTGYHGFQRQPEARTVQGDLEDALGMICGHAVSVTASGRTDAGVHALGQVVHFDTLGRIPVDRIPAVLTRLLGGGVVVRGAAEARADFHARFTACDRTYHYYLRPGTPLPMLASSCGSAPASLPASVPTLRRSLAVLRGTHDFSGLASEEGEHRSGVRTLRSVGIRRVGSCYRVELTADSFLRCMVRNIVGFLLQIASREAGDDVLEAVLKGGPNRPRCRPAPPQGLFLFRVRYPDPHADWPHVLAGGGPEVLPAPPVARRCRT